jgi:hypothetical protein
VRPLPARPNLEFERKQAKKLLALLHKGDPQALARVRAKLKQSADTAPDEIQLSDAQFTIAREYGFTSWPRLVEYFETLAIHELSGQRAPYAHERLENSPKWILRGHAGKLPWTAAALSRFVPRFYGRSAADTFASGITQEEAQLVAARMHRFPSWQAYLDSVRPDPDRWHDDSPRRQAFRAVKARDLDALKRLLVAHPELTQVTNPAEPWASSILYSVIHSEMRWPRGNNREDSEWLVTTGLDLTSALNWLLLCFMRTDTQVIQWLLDHGADPNWVPPNGIPVLEHAIYRYWNGEAVDLIARRVQARDSLWIAAGLGDVTVVKRYFDKNGKLTDAAREHRPDFTAMGYLPSPSSFGDSDLDILWESFMLAAWNDRFTVMDMLLDHGLPIDYSSWDQPFIGWAIFEGRAPLVEYLIKRGANVDAHLRESVEEGFARRPNDPARQRILELCSGRPADEVIREYEERRDKRVMQTAPQVEKAFDYAKLDALHLGLAAVSPENLFVGLMREDGMAVYPVVASGVDLLKLRQALGQRFEGAGDPPAGMTADDECRAILMAARKEAELRKHGHLTTVHMFYALMRQPPQQVLHWIRGAGGEPAKVLAETEGLFTGID